MMSALEINLVYSDVHLLTCDLNMRDANTES